MKIQIRRNVFETNSSSVHTLSLKKVDANSIEGIFDKIDPMIKADILENGIKFGKNYKDWHEYYADNSTNSVIKDFRYKCDELWESVLGESACNNLQFLFKFLDNGQKLSKILNIKVEFCTEPEYVSQFTYNENSLVTELDTPEALLKFIGLQESNLSSYDNNYYNSDSICTDDIDLLESWE